jgi:hypothetical protein
MLGIVFALSKSFRFNCLMIAVAAPGVALTYGRSGMLVLALLCGAYVLLNARRNFGFLMIVAAIAIPLLGVGVGTVAGRIAERIGSFALCLIGAAGLVALTTVLALPLPTWAIAGGIMVIGPIFPLLMTGIYPLIAAASDDLGLAHGSANGFINICWSGATAVVPLAAAQIASARGDAAAYGTAALITVALVAIAALMRSRARNLSLSY